MTDTQGCGWDGVHWSIDQLVADGSANARHELARRLRAAETEAAHLRMRCDKRDRSAARWSEAAKREVPTPKALERARERFVECKIRQEDAPPGSIMRRVCDAAMGLADLLEQRETTMRARVVELALEVERLRAGLRRAFDAGARAMSNAMKRRRKPNWVWDTLKKDYTWDGKTYVSTNVRVDITKLPGRPEVRP